MPLFSFHSIPKQSASYCMKYNVHAHVLKLYSASFSWYLHYQYRNNVEQSLSINLLVWSAPWVSHIPTNNYLVFPLEKIISVNPFIKSLSYHSSPDFLHFYFSRRYERWVITHPYYWNMSEQWELCSPFNHIVQFTC